MIVEDNLKLEDIIKISDENKILHNIMFELNTTCNWKCKHCYLPKYSKKGKDKEDIIKLLHKLRNMGVYEITFTGGEIFCRSDIMEILEATRALGFNVVLFTNASLLSEKIIKRLAKIRISLLSCTLFSMDPDVHDNITRVRGSFNRTLGNILYAKKMGLEIEVKCIVMSDNYDTYSSLIDFCKENDLLFRPDIVIFSRTDGNKEPQRLLLNERQMKKVISNIDNMVGYTPKVRDEEEYVCPSIRHSISIDVDGNVNPCNRIPLSMGNVFIEDIENIWNNSKELNYIRNLKWKDLEKCKECRDNQYCVRCAGAALLEDGGILEKSSLACKIARVRAIKYRM